MRVVEILELSSPTLKALHRIGISVGDCKYIEMYDEFEKMKREGNKTTYAVAVLSEKYGICERKIYKIINKLSKDCQIRAVE